MSTFQSDALDCIGYEEKARINTLECIKYLKLKQKSVDKVNL